MIKDLAQERSKISFLHKEKPMAPIKTIEDFAKKRGKISFPDEKKSIDKIEDLNKVKVRKGRNNLVQCTYNLVNEKPCFLAETENVNQLILISKGTTY